MRIVPKAVGRPHVCAVYPHIGGDHPRGYFDTGNELVGFDPHIYVSVVAAEHMASDLGWVEPAVQDDLQQQISELAQELARETARADAAEAKLQAIDVLESEGFRARKKAGRPKKQESPDTSAQREEVAA